MNLVGHRSLSEEEGIKRRVRRRFGNGVSSIAPSCAITIGSRHTAGAIAWSTLPGFRICVHCPAIAVLVVRHAGGLADDVVREVCHCDGDALQEGRVS